MIAIATINDSSNLYQVANKVICPECSQVSNEPDILYLMRHKKLRQHNRMTFGERVKRSTVRSDQLNFTNICGPMEVNNLNRNKYEKVEKEDKDGRIQEMKIWKWKV